ncbi:MAG: extracellular solute-binding protein [Thermohalobaculum sp.]
MDWTRRDVGRLAAGAGAIAALPPGLAPGLAWGAGTTVSHGVSAFGDLKYPAGFARFDYVNPDAPVGGVFSTGYGGGTFDSLNTHILKGNPAIGMGLTFDSLMTGADDEADSLYGLVARSIEYPTDRLWAAFDLRQEARFSDGSPVTAEDLVFTFEILRDKGHPSFRLQLAAVTGVTAEGPLRVRYDFHPEAPRRDLPMTVAGLPILSKAYYQTRDFTESTLEAPLASGPYMVEKAVPNRTITYRRRDDYWGWHLPVNRGRWNYGRIRFEYFRDRSASFEAFKAGTYTFNEEFWSKLWATGYDFPALRRGDVVRETIPDNTPSGSQGYWFNLRRKKFQDPKVREAISISFDFEWSNSRLFYKLYNRTDSFFEGGTMQAAGKPTPGELALLEPLADQLPPGVIDDPAYVPPVSDGSGRNRKSLRRAAQLLDDAGWKVRDGLRRNDKGETLTIEFLETSGSAFDRITVPYTKNLKKIGVDAQHRQVDPAQYARRIETFDFDIVVSRKVMRLTPGVELRRYFHSGSANSDGSQNYAGVASPVVDALIDAIERTTNRQQLTNAVKALDRVLRAMHIWVPQWHKGTHTLAYWDIYGRPAVEPLLSLGEIDLWWIDPEKHARLKDQVGG